MEEWKVVYIEGIRTNYDISSLGRLRSRKTLRILKLGRTKFGRLKVQLCVKCKIHAKDLHVLVAEYFIGPRLYNRQIHHKDGNIDNNASSNLEYLNASKHVRHHRNLQFQLQA